MTNAQVGRQGQHLALMAAAACAFLLCSELARAQPALAASGSPAAASPTSGSAEEARALTGWEYMPAPGSGQIKPGLSCREGGSGPVAHRGKELPGWRVMTFDCDDHITLALGREWREPGTERLRVKVLDAVALPGATLSATLHHKAGLAMTGLDNNCKLDGRYNPNLVVTMRRGKHERLTWRNGLVAAWTYDLARERIVSVPIKRVVCYQELDP